MDSNKPNRGPRIPPGTLQIRLKSRARLDPKIIDMIREAINGVLLNITKTIKDPNERATAVNEVAIAVTVAQEAVSSVINGSQIVAQPGFIKDKDLTGHKMGTPVVSDDHKDGVEEKWDEDKDETEDVKEETEETEEIENETEDESEDSPPPKPTQKRKRGATKASKTKVSKKVKVINFTKKTTIVLA